MKKIIAKLCLWLSESHIRKLERGLAHNTQEMAYLCDEREKMMMRLNKATAEAHIAHKRIMFLQEGK